MISWKNNIVNILWELESFHNRKPISYLVLDDFIDSELFIKYENIIRSKWYKIVQNDISETRKNKTIYVPGEEIADLYDFFSSSFFEDYVSEIFGEKCTKEFYITQEQIQEHCWNTGLIWQLYEGSDIFDWHVDGYSNGVSLWSFTYYLWWYEGEWKEEYGWILELWEWKWGDISTYEKIVPKKNRIVFILYSDTAFHRVTSNKSHLPRLSLQSTIIKVL